MRKRKDQRVSLFSLTSKFLVPARHGIEWAVSELPGGAIENDSIVAGNTAIRLMSLPPARVEDDFAITFPSSSVINIAANSAVGVISALLRLGVMLREEKRRDTTQRLRFRTRNYKHELRLNADSPRCITKYTDGSWHALCRNLVSR